MCYLVLDSELGMGVGRMAITDIIGTVGKFDNEPSVR